MSTNSPEEISQEFGHEQANLWRSKLTVYGDGDAYPTKSKTFRHTALRWFIDTLAFAGAGMAGVYWIDPSQGYSNQDDLDDQKRREQERTDICFVSPAVGNAASMRRAGWQLERSASRR